MAIEPAFSSVRCLLALISDSHDIGGDLTDEEALAISRAVAKRRQEFAAGRSLARQALSAIGVDPVSIPVSPGRYPVWPDGVVGSISHTGSHVGVALARSSDYAGIGLDLEARNSVKPELFKSVLTEPEQEHLSTRTQIEAATLLFSCKESIFKAANPVLNEFIDFLDVQIDIGDGQFRATCNSARRSAAMVNSGVGYFEIGADIVKSLFLIEC